MKREARILLAVLNQIEDEDAVNLRKPASGKAQRRRKSRRAGGRPFGWSREIPYGQQPASVFYSV